MLNDVVYSPLEQNADIESGIELETTNDNKNSNNSNINNNDDDIISIKVLNKEKAIDINNISKNDTIKQLKEKVYTLTQIEIPLQRLIYGGKPLRPDDKTLSFFKIENGTTVHLFPIPVAAASAINTTATNATVSTSSIPYSNFTSSSSIDNNPNLSNLLYDPYVQETCRQVKVWSIILLVLSYMALFNNTSYILSTGYFGNGLLDSIVTLLDTLCSIAGIYVGQLGLLTTRNLDIQVAKKYAKYLVILATVCIAMRVLWVLDVVSQIQQVVKNSAALHNNNNNNNNNNNSNNSDGSNGSNDDYNKAPEVGENVVQRFTIQASIIALIIIASWISCAVRGVRLRNLLQHFEESQNPNPTSTV